VERAVRGGLGVLLDDLLAGALAAICFALIRLAL
jgi:phosphatidylglycerophosphatase A